MNPVVQLCYVNCGLPGDQCTCYRLNQVYQELLARQEPLEVDFDKVWFDNVEELYES